MGKNKFILIPVAFVLVVFLAAAFTFIIALCAVLMQTPFFATLNGSEEDRGDVPAVQRTVSHKVIFWSSMILTAIIACLDYIPLANLSIQIFPVGNSASVFTFVFPARMINAILLWALIKGTIGLVIFFGTTLAEYAWEKSRAKAKGTVLEDYDWGKFQAIKIRGGQGCGAAMNTVKAILLAVLLFGVFYALVQVNIWIFHEDFRFMLVSAAPLNPRMFVTALEYIPILFVFYISNSIRVNCSIGREGWSEWKTILVGALANSLGLAFIVLINYNMLLRHRHPLLRLLGRRHRDLAVREHGLRPGGHDVPAADLQPAALQDYP